MARSPEERKHLRRYVAVGIVFLLLVLGGFFGIRMHSWLGQRQNTRSVALVNKWNRMDDSEYSPRLTSVEGGFQVDSSCAEALERMLDDCRSAGGSPKIIAAYLSRKEQEALYAKQVEKLIALGTKPGEAEELAALAQPRPGSSEHELGLAVDIVEEDHEDLDETQTNTATYLWLSENAWRYGFILRYPEGKTDITGARFAPWHYRYVGSAAAWQIQGLNITLEEYVSLFYREEAEIVFAGED